ncbi:glycosyltransferase family 8 protein [Streptomyces acidiscabies]|uniref:Glycosyltransferase family 8 protein n=1 Tax=Streptomyces acidiscabies TaxID=42234 RepID=A0AAP6BLG0_9ACTN|nr:glycosyltransferase family 8 protein [Streptomyces acidiscabies]MBZ3916611.1 glycosyltransferase family 8 protein [Streptomyces acidiscabies]MDX2966886.1 glycosyltransferase family 8 protein [Streptomyces acidiscabies]MDX3020289.1 glycosyltransferase family 8 protein [Streptomyces acidiscabies]MDX3791721.1 glycosyltransferase family 8 protein [Streptomyces acidiscabies]GAV44979.1 general stress protein A [Streptomyces acidiscabies]
MSTSTSGVVLCFDSTYTWPACVAMHSVIQTWESPDPLNIYCLCNSTLTPADRAAVESVGKQRNTRLHIIDIDISVPEIRIEHLSAMAYARAVAPELIDAEFLVYIDCDVIACASLHTLLRPIASDYPLAAARDVYGPELAAPHIGPDRFPFGRRAGTFPYFNSGVMAIDVARWRKQKITPRVRDLMRDPDWRPALDDQDTLNHVLDGRFEMLDPRWNVVPVGFLNRSFNSTSIPGDRYVPAEYQRDLEESPWMVHYLTGRKPWLVDYGDDPLGHRWHAVETEVAGVLGRVTAPRTG